MDPSDAVRGEVRQSGYRRLSHGLYLPLREDRRAEEETRRDLAGWMLVLPPNAVFTHITAAYLRRWWLPKLPRFVPVFAATQLHSNRPRRSGLVCSRLGREVENDVIDGLPVDAASEVLLRSARDLSVLDLVPMIDAALRIGDVAVTELDRICASSRPGVRQLRLAVSLADSRSESPWESILRLFHHVVEIDVTPQVQLHDAAGRWVARADLWVPGTPFVHEYDGLHHARGPQRADDLRRTRRLHDAGFIRRGYVADDLINHPLAMLQEMDRELGRRSQSSRLTRWRRWVAQSSYSDEGRRRLQNRWLRRTGITDWSQTA
ncbi:MAG: hypothetical protein WBQ50_03380 [Nocardioides sp.]